MKDEKRDRAEQNIRKKYHKQLFSPFAKACKIYKLIEDGDHMFNNTLEKRRLTAEKAKESFE